MITEIIGMAVLGCSLAAAICVVITCLKACEAVHEIKVIRRHVHASAKEISAIREGMAQECTQALTFLFKLLPC